MQADLNVGELIAEGKTKRIYQLPDEPGMALFEAKTAITAHDDPSLTKEFESKARCATVTTCRVFELLARAGIPVAYDRQVSDTAFVGRSCRMIPLKVVARRYAVGSFTQRHPELARPESAVPHRFHSLKCEFFLKTTHGKAAAFGGNHLATMPYDVKKLVTDEKVLGQLSEMDRTQCGAMAKALYGEDIAFIWDGQLAEKLVGIVLKPKDVSTRYTVDDLEKFRVEDPLIRTMDGGIWSLHHSKLPPHDPRADLDISVMWHDILPQAVTVSRLMYLLQRVFLVLEGAWAQLGMRFIDLKIEFGVDANGNLLVADVIDNDSWRLRTADWQDVSKQSFRDGQAIAKVEEKYQLVAALVEQFRVPRQAVVFWRGSDKDKIDSGLLRFGFHGFLEGVDIVCSGHKSPQRALQKLEDLLTEYPDGGVIIACVGMSNGLGPILAARTSWSVIAVCASADKHPEDLWSSLRMPSNVPLLVASSLKNARLAALNVLAQKNPIAYMERQLELEKLDD